MTVGNAPSGAALPGGRAVRRGSTAGRRSCAGLAEDRRSCESAAACASGPLRHIDVASPAAVSAGRLAPTVNPACAQFFGRRAAGAPCAPPSRGVRGRSPVPAGAPGAVRTRAHARPFGPAAGRGARTHAVAAPARRFLAARGGRPPGGMRIGQRRRGRGPASQDRDHAAMLRKKVHLGPNKVDCACSNNGHSPAPQWCPRRS